MQELSWPSPNSDITPASCSRVCSDLKHWSFLHFKYEKGSSEGQVCNVYLTHNLLNWTLN